VHGCGFKPWETQRKLHFCHFWSSFEVERLRKSLAEVSVRGSWKASQLVSLNGHFSPLNAVFRLRFLLTIKTPLESLIVREKKVFCIGYCEVDTEYEIQ